MKYAKFSHKTPHLKGKQHQLDPNLDLKQLVHHATVQYVDRDADGDVDVYDNPKKKTPDENPIDINVGDLSKKLIAKQKGELKHTKRGMAYEETKSGDESLRDWFNKSSGTDPKTGRKVKGWRQIGGPFAGAPCARQPGQTSKPKCGSSKMAANLSPEEEEKAFRRKNKQDPNPDREGKAKMVATESSNPLMTGMPKPQAAYEKLATDLATDLKRQAATKSAKDARIKQQASQNKMTEEKDACYSKVKSRYKVWPSAYASGALVKCRKVGAKNWGTTKEEHMHEEERYCPICNKRETRSECSYGGKVWDKVSIKDEEYSMARSELSTIMNAVKRLKSKVEGGEGNLEAWVQSKITKAADYIDTAADYVAGGEMDEEWKMPEKINPQDIRKSKRSKGIRDLSHQGSTEGERSAAHGKRKEPKIPLVRKGDRGIRNINAGYEPSLVNKITNEILDEKCWDGYKRKKGTAKFAPGSCVKEENVTIEDANGNTFAEVVDIIKPEAIKGFKSQVDEATRMQAQTGNVIMVTLSWRGKYYSMKMFFPQVKLPTRKEINDELQKVYPGSNVVYHSVSEIQPGKPLIQVYGPQGGSAAKMGSNKNYVKPMGEEVEISEAKKSEMKCNKPKSEAHGSGETGKSHVVKACEGGKEKLIRFGQLGVKGSPKKKGESEEYASRRRRFKTRHAKNIARGKMSAAYWANKVKW